MINEGDFHRHNYVTEKEQSAVNGTFMFNNLQITLIPGTYALLVFQIHDLEINGIAKDFVESPEMMVVFSRHCKTGEEQTPEGTCRKCGFGKYMIVVVDR